MKREEIVFHSLSLAEAAQIFNVSASTLQKYITGEVLDLKINVVDFEKLTTEDNPDVIKVREGAKRFTYRLLKKGVDKIKKAVGQLDNKHLNKLRRQTRTRLKFLKSLD